MSKNLYSQTKRIFALLLCCLILMGLTPIEAHAFTAQRGVPYFDFSYESDGTEIMYHAHFELGGYEAGDDSGTQHRVRIWINEEEAWCIEPGHHLVLGDELQLGASDTWNRLSADVKNGILTVLAFGRPGNSARIGGSDGSQTVATQLLIWEMVCGARNPVTFERYNDCILNCICAGGHHPEVKAVYNNIVNYMMSYKKMPSFANGSTQSMTYENGKYSITLTDNKFPLNIFDRTCDLVINMHIPHSAGNDTKAVSLPAFFIPKTKHKTRRYHLPRHLIPSPGKAVSAFVISDTKGGLS